MIYEKGSLFREFYDFQDYRNKLIIVFDYLMSS